MQSEKDRRHNEEIMAREQQRAAEDRAKSREFHDRMSSEIRQQEQRAKAQSGGSGSGCLALLVAAVAGSGAVGHALMDLVG